MFRQRQLTECVQEMRFAQPRAAVEKERIVRFAGMFRDGERRRMRELIRFPDDKCREREFRIQRSGCAAIFATPV